MASGEFVCFMDPDDLYPTNDVLSVLYQKAKEHSVQISGGEIANFSVENPNLVKTQGNSFDGYTFKKDKVINYTDYQFDYGFTRFLYNRKMLLENSIYFPAYKRFQDPPFFVRAMFCAKKFYGCGKVVYAYRVSHKKVNWNEERICDMLNGILDNMRFANEYELDKLKFYTIERLKGHYKYVYDYANSTRVYSLLNEIKKEGCNVVFIHRKYLFNTIIKKIFSIGYSENRKHKVVKILKFEIKIKKVK